MQKSRGAFALSLLGHDIQVFGDISPFTTKKHRSLKPFSGGSHAQGNQIQMGSPNSACPSPNLTDSIHFLHLQKEKLFCYG